jgi:myosin heavy subunit
LQKQLDEANKEIGRLKRELDFQISLASIKQVDESPYDDFDAGDSAILRSEIEHLQSELLRRETEIEELLARDHLPAAAADEGVDESDTARLVERLEQLLDELAHSDERVRNLENLLKISDEATMAERAEREQLSVWVSEIESRFAEREQQARSARQRLEENLREATLRYERAEKNVRQVVESNAHELQLEMQAQIAELNKRNEVLMQELAQANTAFNELGELISKTGMSREEIEALNTRQAELRQHEIELAQERAALARQRAEIAGLHDTLERATQESPEASIENPDQRIRQFRAHLREIHEVEQEEKRQRSLSGRISRLFKRLDEK